MEVFLHRAAIGRSLIQAFVALILVSAGLQSLQGEETTGATVSESAERVPWSDGQARAVSLLRQVRPEQQAPLFLLTDPKKDPDDLSVLVETKYLQELGFVDLRCVLTTLGDQEVRTTRAKFARSVLDDLGMKYTRVGVG